MGKVLRFWGLVIVRFFKTSNRILGIRGRIIEGLLILIGLIVLSFLTSLGIINTDLVNQLVSEFEIWALISGMVIIFIVLMFLLNLGYQPAKMYEELGGFVKKPIIICPEPHPENMGITNYYRGLSVRNQSAFDVEECMLRLMDGINLENGLSIIRRPENLIWSSRERESAGDMPKTIPGNLSKICDFAGWRLDSQTSFFTLAFGPLQLIPIGEHRAVVRITGKWQGNNINYNEELYFSFDGIQILLGDERLEKEQEKKERV